MTTMGKLWPEEPEARYTIVSVEGCCRRGIRLRGARHPMSRHHAHQTGSQRTPRLVQESLLGRERRGPLVRRDMLLPVKWCIVEIDVLGESLQD